MYKLFKYKYMMKLNVAYLLLFCILFISCDNVTEKFEKDDTNNIDVPDQVCYNMEFVFFDSNTTKTIINSKRARVYNDKKETILDGEVFVRFYNANGIHNGTLTADVVNIDDETKDMVAENNVVVISNDNQTKLETSKLNWQQSSQKIHTDVYVKITSPNEIIEGIGLISDEHLSNYKIFKVTGVRYN